MQLKILNKQENPLLSRTEVSAELTFEGAVPSANEVKKEINKQLGADFNLIDVSMESEFGSKAATAQINVYKDDKAMKAAIKKGKKALEKEKKAAEEAAKKAEEEKAAAEAPKEEAPAEEKKEEEKPAEEKKEEAPKEEKKE